MSKPISFGFGKPKTSGLNTNAISKPSTTATASSVNSRGRFAAATNKKSQPALRPDDGDEVDEDEPQHETVIGFSSSGAILSKPVEEKKERVIENSGNQDWRQRGRGRNDDANPAAQGADTVMVEKDEVSTASGLQFATAPNERFSGVSAENTVQNGHSHASAKPASADEEALQALLGDADRPRGTATIEQQGNTQRRPHDETDDFRADVASRPESSTLEDYAAMPVEEFGLAMLRGMGKKRRANGEIIHFDQKDEQPKKFRKQEGFLGIGAKPVPGMDGVELGAWGKADMRKNSKGAGFFTPLMMKNRETGETITEEELERRKREEKENRRGEEDWRDRRDKNLARHGRERERNGDDRYRDEMNGFSRRNRDDGGGYESSRSRRDRDDSDYDSSRSRRHRSRSRDRRKTDEDDSDRETKRRERRREDRDDERYESSSSRKDKDKVIDRYRERHRESHRDRDRDTDDRRHRHGR